MIAPDRDPNSDQGAVRDADRASAARARPGAVAEAYGDEGNRIDVGRWEVRPVGKGAEVLDLESGEPYARTYTWAAAEKIAAALNGHAGAVEDREHLIRRLHVIDHRAAVEPKACRMCAEVRAHLPSGGSSVATE